MSQLMPLLYGVVLPLVGSTLILLAGRLLPARSQPSISVLAAVLAFTAAQIALTGRPELPPSEASQWLVWLLPALLILGLAVEGLPRLVQALSAALAVVGTLYLLLRPMVQWTWESNWVAAGWLLGYSLLAGLIHVGLAGLAGSQSERRLPRFSAIGLLTAAAIALAATGSLMLGQLAGAMAAALGPLALAKPRSVAFPPLLVYLLALLLAALLAMGVCYSNLPLPLAGLLALAGLALWLPARWLQRRAST